MFCSTPARVLGVLAVAGCDPVLLVADTDASQDSVPRMPLAAAAEGSAAAPALDQGSATDAVGSVAPAGDSASTPSIELTIKAVDCGNCFDLTASGRGGQPPYRFEWEDGSGSDLRHVCVESSEEVVSVTAEDSAGRRSEVSVATLQTDADSGNGCAETASPAQLLCLVNPSFEGTATVNTGQLFDAPPWSDCTDDTATVVSNTPDVASHTLDPVTGIAPEPSDGSTYLAMIATEQASQQLCEALPAGARASLQLDAMSFDLGGPKVFLQVWAGDATSCTRRQLLWTSPALPTTWQTYCLTFEPSERLDFITLRADAPMPVPMLMTTYLAVDNIVPVTACP
jgi:hypothetical protein